MRRGPLREDRCKHCDAWQGLRTKHCHECGRCVRKFDHHCFWVGTCVGEKNHARFTTYLGTQTALIVWAFHISNTGVRYQQTFTELFEKNAGPVFMSFALFLFILFGRTVWVPRVLHAHRADHVGSAEQA